MGRPPIFSTDEELRVSIEEYFESDSGKTLPTVTGLALHLGFESRQSFYDYEKNDKFSYTIKRARLRIESNYESMLYTKNPTGAIFALKNFGWKDKIEQGFTDNDGKDVKPSIILQMPNDNTSTTDNGHSENA